MSARFSAFARFACCFLIANLATNSSWAKEETGRSAYTHEFFEDVSQLDRVEAVNTKEIVRQYLIRNPQHRKYSPHRVSTGYEDDESRPALRLDHVWVSDNEMLFAISGLPRKRNSLSAIMRRDTLQIKNSKGEASFLRDFEGVTELRDRRGGSALVVSPGDILYLLFGKIDDFSAYTLFHVNRDGRTSTYFDAIDPRFRERYDSMFSAATTPDAMKDFLVEFSRNDPDGRVLPMFSRLISQMRSQNTFQAFRVAYTLLGEPRDYEAMKRTAVTGADRSILEKIEAEILAEAKRKEDARLEQVRQQEMRRAAEERAERARLAEQKCMSDPPCRRQVELRQAECLQTIRECRAGCDRLTSGGSGIAGGLASAFLARTCYTACKCDNGVGTLVSKYYKLDQGEPMSNTSGVLRNDTSAKTRSSDGATSTTVTNVNQRATKTFVCTIYCENTTGPTIKRETTASSRQEAARLLSGQADQLCHQSGFSRASSPDIRESQCVAK
jgi:hypothetical protein